MRTPAIVTAAAILMPAMAAAQDGSATAGERLARDLCSECHAIAPDDPTPLASEAPSFQQVAESEHNAQSLRVFLRTPHETMPNIVLNDAQRDDVTAYIMSLRRGD